MPNRKNLLLATFVSFVWLCALGIKVAGAQSLKVVDQKGLARAYQSNVKEAKIIITVADSQAAYQIRLLDVDGVSPAFSPSRVDGPRIFFEGVPAGTWRIELKPRIAVTAVEILK